MSLALIARLALRSLRGGFRGFGIFFACIALGVATVSGVGSLASRLDLAVEHHHAVSRVDVNGAAAHALGRQERQLGAGGQQRVGGRGERDS